MTPPNSATFTVHPDDQELIKRTYSALELANCTAVKHAIDRSVLRGGAAFDDISPIAFPGVSIRRLKPFVTLALRHAEGIARGGRYNTLEKKRTEITETFEFAGYPLTFGEDDAA